MTPSASADQDRAASDSAQDTPLGLVWSSFLVALVALLGSLWLSVGMNLKACPLCLYQRTFVMGVVGVLGVGLLAGRRHRGVLALLALPAAVGGFGVAAFHEYLEQTGKLECPGGVMGVGTAPQQSLAVLTLLLALAVVGAVSRARKQDIGWGAGVGAVATGVLFAVGAVASAPPMPAPPTKAYETPLEICRPPFRPQEAGSR
jgi:disulfide bond formation protein DsbB